MLLQGQVYCHVNSFITASWWIVVVYNTNWWDPTTATVFPLWGFLVITRARNLTGTFPGDDRVSTVGSSPSAMSQVSIVHNCFATVGAKTRNHNKKKKRWERVWCNHLGEFDSQQFLEMSRVLPTCLVVILMVVGGGWGFCVYVHGSRCFQWQDQRCLLG